MSLSLRDSLFLGGHLFQIRLQNILSKTLCDLSQILGAVCEFRIYLLCPQLLVNCEGNEETKSWFLDLKLNEAGMW